MNTIQTKLPLDTWITATWEEYIKAVENVELEKIKSYYHDGEFKIEMTPVGPDHAYDNGIIIAYQAIARNSQIPNYTEIKLNLFIAFL